MRVLKAMTVEDPGGGRTRISYQPLDPRATDPEAFKLPEAK